MGPYIVAIWFDRYGMQSSTISPHRCDNGGARVLTVSFCGILAGSAGSNVSPLLSSRLSFPTLTSHSPCERCCSQTQTVATLKAARSMECNIPPLKGQYSKEFYRCIEESLKGRLMVSLEFMVNCGTQAGSLDFFIPDMAWGIELLRSND